jgi:hypothetical protein
MAATVAHLANTEDGIGRWKFRLPVELMMLGRWYRDYVRTAYFKKNTFMLALNGTNCDQFTSHRVVEAVRALQHVKGAQHIRSLQLSIFDDISDYIPHPAYPAALIQITHLIVQAGIKPEAVSLRSSIDTALYGLEWPKVWRVLCKAVQTGLESHAYLAKLSGPERDNLSPHQARFFNLFDDGEVYRIVRSDDGSRNYFGSSMLDMRY